jgi:hypothetical protein
VPRLITHYTSTNQFFGNANDPQSFNNYLHNLCGGILYPFFPVMSPQNTTLRPQAGGLDAVNQRYEDITVLDFLMEPSLSRAIQDLLNRGAAQQIESAAAFSQQLQHVAAQLGRDFPDAYTSPASRQARDNMRKGLKMLREGETLIRDARDVFRDALVLDGITEDLEDELRRLVKAINDMLNERVIP